MGEPDKAIELCNEALELGKVHRTSFDDKAKVYQRIGAAHLKKNDIKSSTAFKCIKCKKKKCTVSQKQVLAGDEPLTTFVTCLECGYSFSFH